MIMDHIGLFFFPQILLFRIIGRLSFPLFAWLVASGAHHSRDINKYLIRIFILAVISQFPYIYSIHQINSSFYGLNIVFTLFFGLLAIKLIRKNNNKFRWVIIAIILASLSSLLQSDYGALGTTSIVAFYIFYNKISFTILSQIAIFSCFNLIPALISIYTKKTLLFTDLWELLNMISLVSLLFIVIYNKKQGPKEKYLFYIIYPLQFLVFYLIKM